jgi:RND family efflux transporter MFP subunit
VPPLTVLVRSIEADTVASRQQVFTGELRARIETDLAFRVGGKLLERRVDVGAVVRTGDVLALLDPADARLAAGAAAAAVAAAQADLALAQAEFERGRELQRRNFISTAALDARRTALTAAEARMQQARAQAATTDNQARYTRLLADAPGVITQVAAEPGQVVASGQPVLRLARAGEREVAIHVPESRVRDLAPGMAAVVRPWLASGRVYAAQVRELAPAADPATRTYAVRVAVTAPDDALPLGATASVILATAGENGVLLPLSAVSRQGEQASVWVVDAQSTAHALPVKVGSWREDGAFVVDGLAPGARVVISGGHKLVEGAAVRAVQQGAPVTLDMQR